MDVNLDDVASDAEGPSLEVDIVAGVLDVGQLAQQGVAVRTSGLCGWRRRWPCSQRGEPSPKMQETEATTMQSRRDERLVVVESRSRSRSEFREASFSM